MKTLTTAQLEAIAHTLRDEGCEIITPMPSTTCLLDAIQEFEDHAYNPSLKPQVSTFANAVALAAMRAALREMCQNSNIPNWEFAPNKLELAISVINKYCVACTICKFRDCCDYEVNKECNFIWDEETV